MRIKNLPSIESMNGSQDALVIEQTDGSEDKSRKVSPSQIKQYVLNDMDEVPTQNSNNPVKSGGIFNTMAVPKYDATNRREYYEGGAAFDGNIDSSPTAGSNNAVASGGTKSYVDNAINNQVDSKHYKLYSQDYTNVNISTSWGGWYVTGLLSLSYSDLGLTAPPSAVFLSVKTETTTFLIMPVGFTATNAGFYLVRPNANTGVDVTINALVVY